MRVIPYLWFKQLGNNFAMTLNKKPNIWILTKNQKPLATMKERKPYYISKKKNQPTK